MPVIVEDNIFEILPHPSTNIKITRKAPKITFQSANGYKHQREQYAYARRTYDVEFFIVQSQLNTFDNWLDQNGSKTFWWLPPESLWKSVNPTIRLMRIGTEAVNYTVARPGQITGGTLVREPLFVTTFTMEEV